MNRRPRFERALQCAALALAVVAGAGSASADVVRLKNGQSLEGEVTEANGQVKIRSAGGTIGFPASIVLRIERGASVEQQAAERLQALAPNDVAGRIELARELDQAGASTMAQRIFESVLERDPDHPEARRALGWVRCDGEWTSQEECHHRHGLVLHQGRWVSAEQKEALEELDHVRRQSELERLRAEIQVESARLAAERDAAAAASYDYGSPYYDPYYYGGVPYYPYYGYGWGFGGIRGGGRPGGGFDRDRVEHFDRPGRSAAPQGPMHHRGGQPPQPLTPQHHTGSRSAPARSSGR